MGTRRRPAKSYVEVPDSDSDEDFYIPESSISAQAGAESRLKRQKVSRGSEKNPSTNIRDEVRKNGSSKADPSLHNAVIDVDTVEPFAPAEIGNVESPKLLAVSKNIPGDKSTDTVPKSRQRTAKYCNDSDGSYKLDGNLSEGHDSSSDDEIQWRKRPQAVKKESAVESKPASSACARAKQESVQQPPAKGEISEGLVDGKINEVAPKKDKPAVNYCDDSDGSFNIGDEVSDDEDSSSEFEIEAPKKATAARKKPLARSKARSSTKLTSKSVPVDQHVPKSDGAQHGTGMSAEILPKKKKRAVKYCDDSDGSFNMEDDDVSDGEDSSSEFEMEAPKKAKATKKRSPAQGKPAPLRKGLGKTAPSRVSAPNSVQKPLSKSVRNGAGSTAGKRLGARPVLKPKLEKIEKPRSARHGQAKASTPFPLSNGPRYRSGLSKKQPISTRLHSYLSSQ